MTCFTSLLHTLRICACYSCRAARASVLLVSAGSASQHRYFETASPGLLPRFADAGWQTPPAGFQTTVIRTLPRRTRRAQACVRQNHVGRSLTRPMRQENGQSRQTQDRILRATEKLLAKDSFGVISVRRIVQAANTTIVSFYARFRDKNALLPGLLYAEYEEQLQAAGFAQLQESMAYANQELDEVAELIVQHSSVPSARFRISVGPCTSTRLDPRRLPNPKNLPANDTNSTRSCSTPCWPFAEKSRTRTIVLLRETGSIMNVSGYRKCISGDPFETRVESSNFVRCFNRSG